MMRRKILFTVLAALFCLTTNAGSIYKRFFNLTADEVKIDSLLPLFARSVPLSGDWRDSVYTAKLEYAEFIDMSDADVERCLAAGGVGLAAMPVVKTDVVVERKKGRLELSFVPIVMRDGKYKKLVSFMIDVQSAPVNKSLRKSRADADMSPAGRYAAKSVLAEGKWAKIRVPSTGIYQLTNEVIRKAGFSDLDKVKIYGYGGNLQDEVLKAEDLIEYDDLKEVATCNVDGRRLFHAKGPVSWSAKDATRRTRNPYSDYGYYLITENDAEPLTVDSIAFVDAFYPANDDYHTLHETDDFAWYSGGRNLFENTPIKAGSSKEYTVAAPSGQSGPGVVTICATSGTGATFSFYINNELKGTYTLSNFLIYDHGKQLEMSYKTDALEAVNTVKITTESGGPVRLDYISVVQDTPKPRPLLAPSTFPAPEFVYNITNQNLHADGPADMVIIVPASAKLTAQAKRLKEFHEKHDGMRVNLVPADELFNEFSSGTPDANAYRRYLKMLYDRAETDEDMPSYLLLFGDCVWDNRINTSECKSLSADDLLLCYESENSFHMVKCYIDDGFFCCLDDGEGGNLLTKDKLDMAVGRFPVRTEADAKVMVDKTIAYVENKNVGEWQNRAMFIGDDGNGNEHMRHADVIASQVEKLLPSLQVKRVLLDAYTREVSSTGFAYPEARKVVLKQQEEGALVMNYSGHGREDFLSHEKTLTLSDFAGFTNANLPLWITAACDIMPFDKLEPNIGEYAVLNDKGGAVAFFGTTRTVYTNYNLAINKAFIEYLFTPENGKYRTIGEAQRLAKNYLLESGADYTENKLGYALLGDPAIALNIPKKSIVVDEINGVKLSTATELPLLKAGSIVNVKGHVEGPDGSKDSSFDGVVSALVRDSEKLITCRLNDTSKDGATEPYTYYDRDKVLYRGSNNVKEGDFSIVFAVPKDIEYSNEKGLLNLFAVNKGTFSTVNGYTDNFIVGGTADLRNDSIGPSVFCYLNSPTFVNGDNVNTTPYFYAELSDKDGLNTAGAGIGHDLQIVIDGKSEHTYVLNDNFTYDFGSYTSGSTYYNLPELAPGKHTLKFKAWDILNNSTTSVLTFNVVKSLKPDYFNIDCTSNPARTSTTFIITHDRSGSNLDITIDVFDISGRPLWRHSEKGVSTGNTYTVDWDLRGNNGKQLRTGIYIYRVSMSSDGSGVVSKAKKLLVVRN